MSLDFSGFSVALLDCCSVLNLYATGKMAEILQTLPTRCVISDVVAGEVQYVLKGGVGEDSSEREPVNLAPLIETCLLNIWRPETEAEYRSFINFAAELDDGEAVTCALCLHRGGAIVTDERKAHRVLSVRAAHVTVLTTTQLLKHWADTKCAEASEVRSALTNIQQRARFAPGKYDPLLEWWENIMKNY